MYVYVKPIITNYIHIIVTYNDMAQNNSRVYGDLSF